MAEYPHILAANALEQAALSSNVAEDPVFRLVHLADRSRLSKWVGPWSGSQSVQEVRFSFTDEQVAPDGAAAALDTFVLDRSFVLSPGATLSLECATSSNYGSGLETLVTLSNLDNAQTYWRQIPARSRRWWRLRLSGLSAAPHLFNLWLGRRIELTFGPTGEFDPFEEEIVGEPVHGALGGFQWTQRYRRRVLKAGFENLNEARYSLIERWWREAGRDGLNWWWLTWPASRPDDPLYLNCEGASRRFALAGSLRSGTLEAREVK